MTFRGERGIWGLEDGTDKAERRVDMVLRPTVTTTQAFALL